MGRKKQRKSTFPGLIQRNEIWWLEKMVDGQRIRESTGTSDYEEAVRYAIYRLEELRLAKVYGVRPKRVFREAAIKYLNENQHKRSLADDASQIRLLDTYIGNLTLEQVHMGSLQLFIEHRHKQQVKNRTINSALQVVRHILNLAANEWLDDNGLTWLTHAPKIKLIPETDKAPPYPLSWEEQDRFFEQLPLYLQRMALFKVNTGCRDREVCRLQWEWEIPIPELNTSVFVIPSRLIKNGVDRLIVLNDIARQVVDEVRGEHPTHVFTHKGEPLYRMLTRSWKNARKAVGLPHLRVHDLKHTLGRRLRAAGVSFEDRQDLLGHKSARITTHYSAAEIRNLLDAANKVCHRDGSTPILTGLRRERNPAILHAIQHSSAQ